MPEVNIPEIFKPLFEPKRYKVFEGGRGGGKSYAFAQALILRAVQEKTLVLCTRQLQTSISDSVHRILSKQIVEMGASPFFDVQRTTIRGANGSEFIFEGLQNNVTKIKSFEGVDVCWVEEAESVSENSWDVLIPTIRKPGSEIWVSFNPKSEMDNTYQRFIISPPKESVIIKVNYSDNPFFPEELRQEMEEMKERNYKKYLHIYEGYPDVDFEDSIIQPEWVKASIDAHVKLGFKPQGVISTGFDPADQGGDNKAIVTRWGSVITQVKTWLDGDIEEAVDKAFSYSFDVRSDHVVYDSVGVGAAVKMGLNKRIHGKHIVVDAFSGGESVWQPDVLYKDDRKNKDVFRNKRAQFWWYLRDRFEATYLAVVNGTYTDPTNLISLSSEIDKDVLAELKGELTRVQRKRTRTGSDLILLESKVDMRARGVKSPGMADSLAMCFANSMPFSQQPLPDELVPEMVEDY